MENPVEALYDKFELFAGMGSEQLINLNVALGTMRWEGASHDHATIIAGMEHFLITKHVVYMFVAVAVVIAVFLWSRMRSKGDLIPRGVHNFLEPVLMFIRDEIAYPNIKDPHHHDDDHGHGHKHEQTHNYANKFLPLLATFFFFIVTMNIVGLIPGSSTPTASIWVTMGLALITLVTYMIGGMVLQKPFVWGFWKNLVPACPAPMLLIIVPIELMGLIIKPVALTVRLFANMLAGHCVVLSLTGLGAMAITAIGVGGGVGISIVATIATGGIYCLELFVSVVQAYIFTLLSAIFIGMYIAPEH